MENKLDILSKVQKVETPDSMYQSVLAKIEGQQKNTISLTWIRSAAAAVLILISAETYLLTSNYFTTNNDSTAEIATLIPNDNNTLYYE